MAETGAVRRGTAPTYVLGDTPDDAERLRLNLLEDYFDPITQRHLDRLGVSDGWRCLEVAAGAGSITRWLSGRVGPSGSVVATDMNPRFLTDLPANVEVRRHDILTGDLEPDFDLVHCRALLMHLPDPAAALDRMFQALRPGGWLLVDDVDFGLLTFSGHPEAAWATEMWQRFLAALAAAGLMDGHFGRKLPGLMSAAGVESLGGEGVCSLAARGRGTEWDVLRMTVNSLRRFSAAMGISPADYDRMAAIVSHPGVIWMGITSMSMWGRRAG